jgi:hypothetical protein
MFLLRDLITDFTRISFRYNLNIRACLYVHLKGAAFFIYAADVDNIGVEGGLLLAHERRQVGRIHGGGLNQAAAQLIALYSTQQQQQCLSE